MSFITIPPVAVKKHVGNVTVNNSRQVSKVYRQANTA